MRRDEAAACSGNPSTGEYRSSSRLGGRFAAAARPALLV